MVKLGDDWLYIGLGIGAIYLIYKATKPVTDTLQNVSDTVGDILDAPSNWVDYAFSPPENTIPTATEFLFKSPLVTVPALTSGVTDFLFKQPITTQQAAEYTSESIGKISSSGSSMFNKVLPKIIEQNEKNLEAFKNLSVPMLGGNRTFETSQTTTKNILAKRGQGVKRGVW